MEKSVKGRIAALCLASFYLVSICAFSVGGSQISHSGETPSSCFYVVKADFSLHTFTPSGNLVSAKALGGVSSEKGTFDKGFPARLDLTRSLQQITSYSMTSGDLISRFSIIQIIYPFHYFW